jgi:hypothetical protein
MKHNDWEEEEGGGGGKEKLAAAAAAANEGFNFKWFSGVQKRTVQLSGTSAYNNMLVHSPEHQVATPAGQISC